MDAIVSLEIGRATVAKFLELEKLMSKFDDLSAQLDSMVSTVGTIKDEIAALKVIQSEGDFTGAEETVLADKITTLQGVLNDAAAAGAPADPSA